MQPPRPTIGLTGEGFRGERALAILAVGLTIVSTILLIKLTLHQQRQTKMELEKLKKENGENNKT